MGSWLSAPRRASARTLTLDVKTTMCELLQIFLPVYLRCSIGVMSGDLADSSIDIFGPDGAEVGRIRGQAWKEERILGLIPCHAGYSLEFSRSEKVVLRAYMNISGRSPMDFVDEDNNSLGCAELNKGKRKVTVYNSGQRVIGTRPSNCRGFSLGYPLGDPYEKLTAMIRPVLRRKGLPFPVNRLHDVAQVTGERDNELDIRILIGWLFKLGTSDSSITD